MKDTEIEQWVRLKQGGDTYNRYKVSSLGRIYDIKNETLCSHVLTGKPQYFYVNLVNDKGERKLRRVHNIMGWSFLGDQPNKGDTIDHIDRNKYNNSLDNLRWLGRSGQASNQDERTNTLIYKIKNKYPEELTDSVYNYVSQFMRDNPKYSLDECLGLYDLRLKHGVSYDWVEYKNTLTLVPELCEVFKRDYTYTKELLKEGYTLDEILNNCLLLSTCDYIKDIGLEFDGMWYPSKRRLGEYTSVTNVDSLLKCSSLKDYLNKEEDKKHRQEFTRQLQQERLHGKDWGNGIFGTIRGLARKYNIPDGTLWHRVSKVGYTMKEALELPEGNIEHYWYANGKYYKKVEVCKSVGLQKSNVTSRMAKYRTHFYYCIIPDKLVNPHKNRLFILDGNAYWFNDLKLEMGIESKLSLKSVLKTHKDVNSWIETLNLTYEYHTLQEVVFSS